MPLDPDIREETYPYFLQEAPELLQALEQGLLDLQDGCSINQINALMRTTHTLKGAAASVGLETIAIIAHSLEDIFKVLCKPDVSIDPAVAALLFEGYDCLARPLKAEITGSSVNTAEVLDRSAVIFAQLEARLGDCFEQEDYLPSSEELGFDVTQSMFEVGVTERLNDLAQTIAQAPHHKIAATLQIHTEVFFGLAESLGLQGFGAIAALTLAALDQHPEQAATIAQLALADFQAGCAAVLAGDRTQGGQPSAALQQLVEIPAQTIPDSVTETLQQDWLTEFDTVFAQELQQQEWVNEPDLETIEPNAASVDVGLKELKDWEDFKDLENLENSADLENGAVSFFESKTSSENEPDLAELEFPLEVTTHPADTRNNSATVSELDSAAFKTTTEATIETFTEAVTGITSETDITPINYQEIEVVHSKPSQSSPDFTLENALEDSAISSASEDTSEDTIASHNSAVHGATHFEVAHFEAEHPAVDPASNTTEAIATDDTHNTDHSIPPQKTHHQKHRGLCRVLQWIRNAILMQAGLQPDSEFSDPPANSSEVSSTAAPVQVLVNQPSEENSEDNSEELTSKEVKPEADPEAANSKEIEPAETDSKVVSSTTSQQEQSPDTLEKIWAPVILDEPTQPEEAIASSPFALSTPMVAVTEPLQLPAQRQKASSLQLHTQVTSRTTSTPASIARKKHFRSNQVRVNVEHLDQLNYSIGELLTQQNRQLLQNERLQAEVKTLLKRLNQHQQMLSQLQDQVDQSPSQFLSQFPSQWLPAQRKGLRTKPFTSVQTLPPAFGDRFDALELSHYSDSHLLVQSLLDDTVQLAEAAEAIDLFSQQSNQTLDKQQRLLSTTRDALMQARMLPLSEVFNRLPPVLQQLETLHDKQATLEMQGSEVLVDKAIAEKLYDPLLHLIRNAFDHAIEPVVVRRQQGKPDSGQIEINAYHQGKYLIIEVRDDGKGLDYERIRQRLVERQLVSSEQANTLTQSQLIDFLFEPGFSTVTQANKTSGRGVGLDVVREQILGLQGSVTVQSTIKQGATFILQIPLSLAIAKLLVCQVGTRTYALTTDAIEHILIPTPEQIQERQDRKVLHWRKGTDLQLIQLHSIAKLLNYSSSTGSYSQLQPAAASPPTHHVILIRHQGELIGLEVDQLVGEQELVICPLGTRLESPNYIQGASVLADGQLTLVVDGGTLLQQVLNQQLAPRPASPAAHSSKMVQPPLQTTATLIPTSNTDTWENDKTILIAEDSITVRQTLTLTLQKAGYQVLQAKDGQEAIEQLQLQNNVRLMFCDLEMPRMNGFEFLKQRQQFPTLTDIPVIVLTSRSGEKHRMLALELGATAYITKPYIEHKLLTMVADLFEAQRVAVTVD